MSLGLGLPTSPVRDVGGKAVIEALSHNCTGDSAASDLEDDRRRSRDREAWTGFIGGLKPLGSTRVGVFSVACVGSVPPAWSEVVLYPPNDRTIEARS